MPKRIDCLKDQLTDLPEENKFKQMLMGQHFNCADV
jgi:hypothetical protein